MIGTEWRFVTFVRRNSRWLCHILEPMLRIPRVRPVATESDAFFIPLRLRVSALANAPVSWKRENPGNGAIAQRNATDSIRNWYAPYAEDEDIRAEKGIRNSRRFVFIQWLILVLGEKRHRRRAPNRTHSEIEFGPSSVRIEDWAKLRISWCQYKCNYDCF